MKKITEGMCSIMQKRQFYYDENTLLTVGHVGGLVCVCCNYLQGGRIVSFELLRDHKGRLITFDTNEQAICYIEEVQAYGTL